MSTFRPERRPRGHIRRHGGRAWPWDEERAGRVRVVRRGDRLVVYGVLAFDPGEWERVLEASSLGPDTFIRAELPEPREEDAG